MPPLLVRVTLALIVLSFVCCLGSLAGIMPWFRVRPDEAATPQSTSRRDSLDPRCLLTLAGVNGAGIGRTRFQLAVDYILRYLHFHSFSDDAQHACRTVNGHVVRQKWAPLMHRPSLSNNQNGIRVPFFCLLVAVRSEGHHGQME